MTITGVQNKTIKEHVANRVPSRFNLYRFNLYRFNIVLALQVSYSHVTFRVILCIALEKSWALGHSRWLF